MKEGTLAHLTGAIIGICVGTFLVLFLLVETASPGTKTDVFVHNLTDETLMVYSSRYYSMRPSEQSPPKWYCDQRIKIRLDPGDCELFGELEPGDYCIFVFRECKHDGFGGSGFSDEKGIYHIQFRIPENLEQATIELKQEHLKFAPCS